ncbi:hypothetical protein NDU88_005264, partial [Pleurodeles waltl]
GFESWLSVSKAVKHCSPLSQGVWEQASMAPPHSGSSWERIAVYTRLADHDVICMQWPRGK